MYGCDIKEEPGGLSNERKLNVAGFNKALQQSSLIFDVDEDFHPAIEDFLIILL